MPFREQRLKSQNQRNKYLPNNWAKTHTILCKLRSISFPLSTHLSLSRILLFQSVSLSLFICVLKFALSYLSHSHSQKCARTPKLFVCLSVCVCMCGCLCVYPVTGNDCHVVTFFNISHQKRMPNWLTKHGEKISKAPE